MEGAGECVCLFKCSLCQHDKEFDGFIRNTKALFSRVRRAPLGSTQSADKLEKKKRGEGGRGRGSGGRKVETFPDYVWAWPSFQGTWSCGHIPCPNAAALDGKARCVLVSLLKTRTLLKDRSNLVLSHSVFWCPHCSPSRISHIPPFLIMSPVCCMSHFPFHLCPWYSSVFGQHLAYDTCLQI